MIFADQLMYTGFAFSTRASISICVDDMLVPTKKVDLRQRAKEVKEIEEQYRQGLVTQGERATTRWWISGVAAGDQVAKAMMEQLGKEKTINREGKEVDQRVVQRHLHDGRLRRSGSVAQIRQLAGMRA